MWVQHTKAAATKYCTLPETAERTSLCSAMQLVMSIHTYIIVYTLPEKTGRKPGSSLNGDRRVESIGGSAAGGWWGHRGRGGGVGGVRLRWLWAWGALGEKEGMCRKKERREEVW